MNEPLFPSGEEINRRIEIAKQLRSDSLHLTVRGAKHKFAAQTRLTRSLEASAAVMTIIAGILWLGILSAPEVTEAGQPGISKEQSRLP